VASSILKTRPEVFKDFKNTNTGFGAAFFLLTRNEGGHKFGDIKEYISTPLNPSAAAFETAKECSMILDIQDMRRITGDYIKTELARSGRDIMSVFEDGKVPQFDNIEPGLKEKILKGLIRLFSIEEDIALPQGDLAACAHKEFLKNRIINFFTSGSTGIIKNCLHTEAAVKEEAEGLLFLFEGIKRTVCIVPASHSYGFIFGLQVPKMLGVPVVQKPPVPTLKWNEILKEGDLLVAFPMFLKQMLAAGFDFPEGVMVLTSTAPCPDEVIAKIYESGARRFVEIYGASEGGAIGYRRQAGEAFTLLPFWEGYIAGRRLEAIKRKKTPLTFTMPDIIEVRENGAFKPMGRKDNAVQVAGINVFPQKVEAVIKTHAAVDDAAVRLMRPDEGERLKAFIVLKKGQKESEALLKSLRAFMTANLTVHEVPRRITFGPEIPLTDFGKKKDW
jgi:4-coumarate--CoA ligase (photoactive yellow protein activation family)